LEYDGCQFHGFQSQETEETVQGRLKQSINTILNNNFLGKINVAGRTDAGVHGKGMIMNFHTSNPIQNFHKFIVGCNHLSGDFVSILSMTETREDFHARFSCQAREYEYKIYISPYPRPILNQRAFWMHDLPDLNILDQESQSILGENDFRSLARKSSVEGKNSIREIYEIEWNLEKSIPVLLRFRIKANGFLHNMIRILTGTLLEIGLGKKPPGSLKKIIDSKTRSEAGITLPPYGLYFIRAYFPDYPEVENLYELSETTVSI
jgi:tRNA pseudouridine38-40 synthase